MIAATDLGLTERQRDVLTLLMQGKSNKAICRALHLAEPTVKSHVSAIMIALKVTNRTEAVIAARALGIDEQASREVAAPAPEYKVMSGMAGNRTATRPAPYIDLSVPDKPSIAVLPFANMSGDPAQEYFTDGVTEDIITELSRFKSLFVIARNSTFSYKGKASDVRRVGRELGVRYVVEGSIRRAGNRLRISAQLIDSISGNHIWAERYDRELEDVFEVQEEVTRSIVVAITPEITRAEIDKTARKKPKSLGGYEIAVRAHAHSLHAWITFDSTLCDQVIREAEEALSIDPRSTLALNAIAISQYQRIVSRMAPEDDAAWQAGMTAATKAVEIDPSDSLGHAYKAWLHCADPRRGPIVDAMTCARRAVDLNPNSAYALRALGFVQVMAGEPQLAIETVKRALRLSPRDPLRGNWYNLLSMACCIAGQYADGIAYGLVATSETPRFAVAHVYLATNYIGLGETDKAKAALAFARRLAPRFVEKFLGDETTGGLMMRRPEDAHRVTTFARVAAGLEDVGAAISLR
jgi:adenylate cyclase